MRIEEHTSGCVAHMAVLAGKLWFLGKSRSNPLCMGEWVGCGCCLVRLNVGFRELSITWKLLRLDDPCQPHILAKISEFSIVFLKELTCFCAELLRYVLPPFKMCKTAILKK